MADESGLRSDLRAAWEVRWGPLAWVEHNRGGTEGNADVFVPLGELPGFCPLELKWWETGEDGVIKFTARPAQVRFHRLAANANMRTAFLARLDTGALVALPGWFFPGVTSLSNVEAMGMIRHLFGGLKELRATLRSEKFWRGEV